jgi:hypothetical protein
MLKKLIVFFFIVSSLNSQTLWGTSGLFNIPDAKIYEDGVVNFALSLMNKNYVGFGSYQNNGLIYSVTIAFLPFIELNVNHVYLLPERERQGIGDRTISFKIQTLNEEKHFINLAVGINNIGSSIGKAYTIHNHAGYIVVSKSIVNNNFNFILGYGAKLFKAADYQFIGLFGGVSYRPYDFIELIVENDAERFNGALRLRFFKHIHLLAGMMNFKDFSGGISFSFAL